MKKRIMMIGCTFVLLLTLATAVYLGFAKRNMAYIQAEYGLESNLLQYAFDSVTLYSRENEVKSVPIKTLTRYDGDAWSLSAYTMVYTATGDPVQIEESQVDSYIASGHTLIRPDWEGMSDLKKTMERFLRTQNGTWGVYVQNLSTSEYLSINERQYSPASIIKLFTMVAVFHEIENGNLTRTEEIDKNLIAMITESSNTACNFLTRKVGQGNELHGFDIENAVSKSFGCEYTDRGSYLRDEYNGYGAFRHSNYTSPRDCGRLLKAIYNKELISAEASEEMLNLMLAQTRRWKIPDSLPVGTKVANKTGENDWTEADVAIVFSPACDYSISIIGNGAIGNGLYTIQELSKMAYTYFNQEEPDLNL